MDFNGFLEIATQIVKTQDSACRQAATQEYFEFMKQCPDAYIECLQQLFASDNTDLKAFFATVFRKHISEQGDKSVLTECSNHQLVTSLLEQLICCLSAAQGYSHIIADLIGELGLFLLRTGRDASCIWQFLLENAAGGFEYETSVVVWQLSSLQWHMLERHFMECMAYLCASTNYRVLSQVVLTLCNVIFMQLYAKEKDDCAPIDIQQQIIGEIFNIIGRMCPSAVEHVALFKSAMDEFIELFDCAPELFVDNLGEIEQLCEALITQFEGQFELQSIGFALFTALVLEADSFGFGQEDSQRFIEVVINYFYPLINTLSESDLGSFANNENMDFNSPNYETQFYIQQIMSEQFEWVGLPSAQEYLELHANNQNDVVSCILLVSLLFESGNTFDSDVYLEYLFSHLHGAQGIIRFLVLEALQNIITTNVSRALFKRIVATLVQTAQLLTGEADFIHVEFLRCFSAAFSSTQRLEFATETADIVVLYSQSQSMLVEREITRIAGYLVRKCPAVIPKLQSMMPFVYTVYFQLLGELEANSADCLFEETFSVYLEEIVPLDALAGAREPQVIQSIFQFLAYNSIDQVHFFMESLIVAACAVLEYHGTQLKSNEIYRIIEVFLEVMRVPIFEHSDEQSFEDTQVCNNFVINSKEFIFDALTGYFIAAPELAAPYAEVVLTAIDAFDYAKQYQFINVCRLYAAICTSNAALLPRVQGVFDVAMHKTHRTAYEMENLIKSFSILHELRADDEQLTQRIVFYVCELLSMVSRSTQKHLVYFEENGKQADTTVESLEQIFYGSKMVIELLEDLFEKDKSVSNAIEAFLSQEDNEFLFTGCLLQFLFKAEKDITPFLSIIFDQIDFEHNIDMDYLFIIYLQLVGVPVLEAGQINKLQEKMHANPSYIGLLLLLQSIASFDHESAFAVMKSIATEHGDELENVEMIIYSHITRDGFPMQSALEDEDIAVRASEVCETFEKVGNQQVIEFSAWLRQELTSNSGREEPQ